MLQQLAQHKEHEDSAPCVGECDLRLFFSITDTGIGIDPKDQEKLFKSFSQVEQSVDRTYGGTGIGLVISKKLVNLMGGEIMVESSKGAGSTFAFSIFSRDLDSEQNASETCCATESKFSARTFHQDNQGTRIMVTDDNEINRIVAEGLIHSLGYEVQSSNSGKDTLARLKKEHYDLVLMDIQMPGLDGFETTKLIRSQLPGDQQPIVVAMTADSRDEVVEHCYSCGMKGILHKPITEEKLAELFQKHSLLAIKS
jgi:CheY-like chemotaxis protein